MGPPLGVRSMTATCDGAVLLANVHVGGVPRSTDAGLTWAPTIDIESDVHQVCAHPSPARHRDRGRGGGPLRESRCRSDLDDRTRRTARPVLLRRRFWTKRHLRVGSTDPFAAQGAVYRRPIDGKGPLQTLGGGIPRWIDGKADTDCIATRDSIVALIDAAGNLYVSHDDGASWSQSADALPFPSGLYIC